MKRTRIAIVMMFLCLLGGLTGTARAQQPSYSIVLMDFSKIYPPDQWVFARARLNNNTDKPMDGYALLSITRGGEVRFRTPAYVPAHSIVYVNMPLQLPGQPASRNGENLQNRASGWQLSANIEWHAASGQRLVIDELLAMPIERPVEASDQIPSTVLLQLSAHLPANSDAYDISTVRDALYHGDNPIPTIHQLTDPSQLSPLRTGLMACSAIVLQNTSPDSLNQGQRTVLLDYVNAGGLLIIASPTPEENYPASWLGPYLPVQLIGQREQSILSVTGQEPLILREPVPTAEAVAGNGTVVLADSHYVHIAWRSVGMGRVMFVSFPIGSLDAKDPRVQARWHQLIPVHNPSGPVAWSTTSLPTQRDSILSQMVGVTTPSWSLAAGLVGGYFVVVILLHILMRGANQPRAFALSVGLALLLSIGLLVATGLRKGDDQPMAASLITADVSPSGGGLIQEQTVFVGTNTTTSLETTGDQVTLSLASQLGGKAADLRVNPAGVPETEIYGDHYERVWQATGLLPQNQSIKVTGRFVDKGLEVHVDNQMDQPILSPVLTMNNRNFSLPDLARGPSEVVLNDAILGHGASAFVNSNMLTSSIAKLRGQVLYAMQPVTQVGQRIVQMPPRVVGFLPENSAPQLIRATLDNVITRSQAAVRTTLQLEPSEIGKPVHVSGDMMIIHPGTGLPLNPATAGTEDIQSEGTWLIRFAAPAGAGKLRPSHATIDLTPQVPNHKMTLTRQQVSGGKPAINPNGAVLGQWAQTSGAKPTISFDVTPEDVDDNGDIWLCLDVTQVGEPAMGELPIPWRLISLKLGMDADVVGPPVP